MYNGNMVLYTSPNFNGVKPQLVRAVVYNSAI